MDKLSVMLLIVVALITDDAVSYECSTIPLLEQYVELTRTICLTCPRKIRTTAYWSTYHRLIRTVIYRQILPNTISVQIFTI